MGVTGIVSLSGWPLDVLMREGVGTTSNPGGVFTSKSISGSGIGSKACCGRAECPSPSSVSTVIPGVAAIPGRGG